MQEITSQSVTALVHAPFEKINLTEWLFTLRDHEYQACSAAHLGCGTSVSPEGKRMSLNVELIGGTLLVQHYVEDISLSDHCRVNSISDSISAAGNTTLGITWELKIRKVNDDSCELTNRVVVNFTDAFLTLLQHANITDLEPVKLRMAENVKAHNHEETPRFASDIEKKALAGVWS
ncbi:hypothetical protein [Chryseolinea lacunae]|uniref:SRPBCC family protein n=1 Tax=Chryseolinea lacunae TaxID=2801331 RepID=A0ABS1KTK1_9BACT|nr:hypothetical protein [Chryseolinea lacunae]MBL0742685.1 hypothetical protein [Chryseolinea lacunae]